MPTTDSGAAEKQFINPYLLTLAVCWSILVGGSLFWNLWRSEQAAMAGAHTQAEIAIEKDVLYRKWNSLHGGVYVPVTDKTKPNPYLKAKEREVKAASGRVLTLINPAFMTRQVHEIEAKDSGVLGHITSLKPLRPGNAPDPWESAALKKIHAGAPEVLQAREINGIKYLRLIRPLITAKECLPCHAVQGYKVGDIRGGLSVSVPLRQTLASINHTRYSIIVSHLALWIIVLWGLYLGAKRLALRVAERDQALLEKEKASKSARKAQKELRQLEGLLPICASCKKIRDDDGNWHQVEQYVSTHSQAEFTHGVCPECMKKLYPHLVE